MIYVNTHSHHNSQLMCCLLYYQPIVITKSPIGNEPFIHSCTSIIIRKWCWAGLPCLRYLKFREWSSFHWVLPDRLPALTPMLLSMMMMSFLSRLPYSVSCSHLNCTFYGMKVYYYTAQLRLSQRHFSAGLPSRCLPVLPSALGGQLVEQALWAEKSALCSFTCCGPIAISLPSLLMNTWMDDTDSLIIIHAVIDAGMHKPFPVCATMLGDTAEDALAVHTLLCLREWWQWGMTPYSPLLQFQSSPSHSKLHPCSLKSIPHFNSIPVHQCME